MKKVIIVIAIITTTLAACNNSQVKTTDALQHVAAGDTSVATHLQSIADTTDKKIAGVLPVNEIISGYLQLKNALTKDNGKDAAAAGNILVATLEKVDKGALEAGQQKAFADLQDDMKENAAHIGANAGKIEHQREHFQLLSKDVEDLVKFFGNGGQTLYKDFCPMADNGKGAIWLSEVKEIKNPYLGGKMPACGSVKETIK